MDHVHRVPASVRDRDGLDRLVPDDDGVVPRLGRLLRLEVELGLAEARALLQALVIAVVLAVIAAIALVAALVVLTAAAVAPLFGAPWQHLAVAGGGVALLALAVLGWSAWRLTHLSWPTETLKSVEENWQWLAAQLRSRLTLRSRAA
jgi:Putative Actinobacterial Holin-X, holin superfamily III